MLASPFTPRRLTYGELLAMSAVAAILVALAAALLAGSSTSTFAEVPVPITVSDTAVYRADLSDSRDTDLFSVRLEAGKVEGIRGGAAAVGEGSGEGASVRGRSRAAPDSRLRVIEEQGVWIVDIPIGVDAVEGIIISRKTADTKRRA
jgi:hypothetical protein